MKKHNIWILLASLWAGNVAAAEPGMQDFAFAANFGKGQLSLREAILPAGVLERIQHPDFADVRVFNADAASVPFEIASLKNREIPPVKKNLNFFPLEKNKPASPDDIRLELQQAGSIKHLSLSSSRNSTEQAPAGQYIIHNTPPGSTSLCRLHFKWEQPAGNRLLDFSLESSPNLRDWNSFADNLTISRLTQAGNTLENNTVEIPCTQTEYLRLTWNDARPSVSIIQITGIYPDRAVPEYRWQHITAAGLKPDKDESVLLFDNPGIMPISKIQLKPVMEGSIYTGDIFSRIDPKPGEKERWTYRGKLNQYLLQTSSKTLVQSEADTVSISRDPHWKIRLDRPISDTQAKPAIVTGWQPDIIRFLAQGKAPFLLAFGNPNITVAANADWPDSIPGGNNRPLQTETVQLGAVYPLGDVDLTKKSRPWKLVTLWLVLVLGTLVMAYMAYHLYREMDKTGKPIP